jgi:hypothetical protein
MGNTTQRNKHSCGNSEYPILGPSEVPDFESFCRSAAHRDQEILAFSDRWKVCEATVSD